MVAASDNRSKLRTALALVLFAVAGWLLWSSVLSRYVGPAPVEPESLEQVDPAVAEAIRAAIDEVRGDRRVLQHRMRLCMTYQANGLLDSARECWLQVVSLDEDQAPAWFLLAKTYERSGQMDAALQALARAAEQEPGFAAAQWLSAMWMIDIGELEEAQAAVEVAIDLDSSQEAPWFAQARLQLALQEPEKAARTISEHALLEGVNGAHARHLLASAYRSSGRNEEAERVVEGVENRPPAFQDPWTAEMQRYRTGYSYRASMAARRVQNGRYEEALEILQEIEGVDPEDHRIPVLLAQTWIGLGEPDRGIDILEQAVEQHPENALLYTNLAVATLAASRSDRSRFGEAVAYARQAVDLEPESSEARLVLAGALLATEDFESAHAEYRRSFEMDARNPVPFIQASHALISWKRPVEARDLLELLLDSYPQRASVWAGLARIEISEGRPVEAIAMLEEGEAAPIQDAGDLTALRDQINALERQE